jgi:hypothetical protein
MKTLKKGLVYLLAVMMALPTWLAIGLINAPKAEAGFTLLDPVLVEVKVSGTADWVEIYNPNAADSIDVMGYQIIYQKDADPKEAFVVDESVVIDPQSIAVLADDKFSPALDLPDYDSSMHKVTFESPIDDVLQPVAVYGDGYLNPDTGLSLQFSTGDNKWTVGAESEGTYTAEIPVVTAIKSPDKTIDNNDYTLSIDANISVLIEKYKIDDGAWTYYVDPVIVSDEGEHTFYAYGEDSIGQTSESQTSFMIDKTAPSDASIIINDGAEYTQTKEVTLALNATDINGVTKMAFSRDGVHFHNWQAYATEADYTLCGADGVKTVYALFKDSAGNKTIVSDTIILDTGAPEIMTASIASDNADSTKAYIGDTVTVSFTANEDVIASINSIYIDGVATPVIDLGANQYEASRVMTANDPAGLVTFSIEVVDLAGNETVPTIISETTDSTKVNLIKPLDLPVISTTIDGKSLTIKWSAVSGAIGYNVYVKSVASGAIVSGDTAVSVGNVTEYSTQVSDYGDYYVVVTALSVEGLESILPVMANQKIVSFSAPVAVSSTSENTIPTVGPAEVSAAVDQSTAGNITDETSNTSGDDNGIIKGDENNTDENNTNWTPWIILAILVLFAGAATGGYFYWFAGKDDDDNGIGNGKKGSRKPPVTVTTRTKKSSNKNTKRW